MVVLEDRLMNLATLSGSYGVRDSQDFINRTRASSSKDSRIIKLFDTVEQEKGTEERRRLEARLDEIKTEQFNSAEAQKYFSGNSWTRRAGYLGTLAQIIGGVTAAGAIIGLAAGTAPISAVAGVAYGLQWMLGGSVINTVRDVYESTRANTAMNNKESVGVLGYVKKTAQGMWNKITAPFSTSAIPVAQGFATNALAAGGTAAVGYAAGAVLGAVLPYAQVATLGVGTALSHYQSIRKFEDAVAGHILDSAHEELIAEVSAQKAGQVISIADRLREASNPQFQPRREYAPVGASLDYDAAQSSVVGYVAPRTQLRKAA